MKKSFIILFSIFIIACADGEIGGYTESIIKKANSADTNTTTKEETIILAKAESTEEDLSGLDEDELREKLMNTFPKQHALLKSGDITQSNTFELPHNPKNTDLITTISWKEVIPIIEEAPNHHKYGFDRDPYDTSKVVYMSLKEPDNTIQLTGDLELIDYSAYFKPNFSCMAYEKYKILHEQYQNNPAVVASKGIELTSENIEHIKYSNLSSDYYLNPHPNKSVTYTLYGCYKNCDGKNQKWKDAKKQITIIPYQPITKDIMYAQLDGNANNPWIPDDTECKKGFTQNCVTTYFNNVFNQALVYPDIKPATIKQSVAGVTIEGPLYDDLIEVNMTSPDNRTYNLLMYNAIESIKKKDKKYWHVIYAINKERKKWDLEFCFGEDGDLHECNGFVPEKEATSTSYFIKSPDETCATKGGGIGTTEVPVYFRAMDKGDIRHYYAFRKDNNKKANYAACDMLYTDDGYPVVPTVDGIEGSTAAFSTALEPSEGVDILKTFKPYNDYLSYGSIVFVARSVGESGLYTLMHELGHSFGLTDVNVSAIFKKTEHDKKNKSTYNNYYASSETNLMSWLTPSGKRLRYRETPIVCSGGVPLKDNPSVSIEQIIKGKGEFQWDCIRDCYQERLKTKERIDYWKKTETCDPSKRIESSDFELFPSKEIFDITGK